MARPLGPIAKTILRLIGEHGPMSARTLAAQSGISMGQVEYTTCRLVRSGLLRVVDASRMDHARRPLQRFGLPAMGNIAPGVDMHSFELAAVWR